MQTAIRILSQTAGSVLHKYSQCYVNPNSHQYSINHCKRYHIAARLLEKLQSEYFVAKGVPNCNGYRVLRF